MNFNLSLISISKKRHNTVLCRCPKKRHYWSLMIAQMNLRTSNSFLDVKLNPSIVKLKCLSRSRNKTEAKSRSRRIYCEMFKESQRKQSETRWSVQKHVLTLTDPSAPAVSWWQISLLRLMLCWRTDKSHHHYHYDISAVTNICERFRLELSHSYLYIQAPPATVFMHDPQCQIPTAFLFILVWTRKQTSLHVTSANTRITTIMKNWFTTTKRNAWQYSRIIDLMTGWRVPWVSHLATEGAGVFGVLTDLNFLHHLPEGRTITGAVFSHDSHLLGALGLMENKRHV